jgi:hypothetical protein
LGVESEPTGGEATSPLVASTLGRVRIGPGRIRHAWWYGSPGEVAVERDVAELTRVG